MLERDGNQCVECDRGGSDGAQLTMDHVIPFSRGGETTTGNLVTLCSACNGKHGNSHHSHLFALADLHHGWDPELLKANRITYPDSIAHAMMLSDNIMVSRCKLSDLGESWPNRAR